jgi:hypothetical protein
MAPLFSCTTAASLLCTFCTTDEATLHGPSPSSANTTPENDSPIATNSSFSFMVISLCKKAGRAPLALPVNVIAQTP